MKRIIRWGLALCLLLSVMALAPVNAASAASPCDGSHSDWTAIASLEDLASHCSTKPAAYGGEGAFFSVTAGKYYLTADLTLDTYMSLQAGVSLCLNGHTLTSTDLGTSVYMINAYPSATKSVDLCDCTGEGNLYHNIAHKAVLCIGSSGTANLWGINIKNSRARYGAVWVEGVCNMYSGEITGNTGTWLDGETVKGSGSGGFYVRTNGDKHGTLNLYGGSVHDNLSGSSDLRNVYVAAGSTFRDFAGIVTAGVAGPITYPVSVNGAALTATPGSTGDPLALYSDDNVTYDPATATLTVLSPSVTALDWESGLDLTVKLDTDVQDVPCGVPAGQSLTLDLNGHVLTRSKSDDEPFPSFRIETGASMTLKDTSAEQQGAMYGMRLYTNGSFTMESGAIRESHVTSDTSCSGGAIMVAGGGAFTMNGGSIANCSSTSAGGGVCVAASNAQFIMNGGEITGCVSNQAGGGVFLTSGGSLVMNGGSITNCTGTAGGGICMNTGTVQLLGGVIEGNTAQGVGGGVATIFTADTGVSSLVLDGAAIRENTAGTNGGGIGMLANVKSDIQIKSGSIEGNVAQTGGGLYVVTPNAVMTGGSIVGNSALYPERSNGTGGYGGAVNITSTGVFTMDGGEIRANHTEGYYGNVYTYGGSFIMNGGSITGNTQSVLSSGAVGYGVAVAVDGSGSFTMNDGSITQNDGDWMDGQFHKVYGAVSMLGSASQIDLNGGTISGNTTVKGAVFARNGVLNVAGTAITGNASTQVTGGTEKKQNGGGIYMDKNVTVTISGGEVSGNLGATGRDIFPYGVGSSITVTGGTIGLKDDPNSGIPFWAYNDQTEGSIQIAISGGTLYSGLGMGGKGSIAASISGGRIKTVNVSATAANSAVTVTGGKFASETFSAPDGAIDLGGKTLLATSDDAEFPFEPGVIGAVTGVTLDKEALTLEVGGSGSLTATVAPADAANKNVSWTSSDETVAIVDGGVVAALKSGSAVITVTTADGGFTASCTVTVSLAQPAIRGDLNNDGKVNAKDIVILQRFVAGGYELTLPDGAADFNGDNKVNAKDIVILQRFVAGGYDATLG